LDKRYSYLSWSDNLKKKKEPLFYARFRVYWWWW
jgi:hypothetical protein